MKRSSFMTAVSGLMLLAAVQTASSGQLPGDGLASGGRSCFSLRVAAQGPISRLLLELHKEQINPGDEPVVWAAVFAERRDDARSGFNRDGCEANEPGETAPLDHLRCGFACEGGTLRIFAAPGGVEVQPDNLMLRSCGMGTDAASGFLLSASDLGGRVLLTPVDDTECRDAMAPAERAIRDAENAID